MELEGPGVNLIFGISLADSAMPCRPSTQTQGQVVESLPAGLQCLQSALPFPVQLARQLVSAGARAPLSPAPSPCRHPTIGSCEAQWRCRGDLATPDTPALMRIYLANAAQMCGQFTGITPASWLHLRLPLRLPAAISIASWLLTEHL